MIKSFSLQDKFTFGKYKGMLVGRIIDLDHEYIKWMINNTNYSLAAEALVKYDKVCEEYSWQDDSNWEDDDFPDWALNQ